MDLSSKVCLQQVERGRKSKNRFQISSDLEEERALFKQSNDFERSVRKNYTEIIQQLDLIQMTQPQSNEQLLVSI